MIFWILFFSLGVLLLILIGLYIYKFLLKISSRIKTPNGISSLEQITLGGLKQWIFIRSKDQKNPILIFLHGGPGEPVLGMSSSRKYDIGLIGHYTIVHWDQRGAGKSYNKDIPLDSMTLDRLVEDCNELINYLLSKFDARKVFIVAHSGGTLIGLKLAYKYPEKIYAYVGVSQIINDLEQESVSYNYIIERAKESGDRKKLEAIKAIGPPPYETSKHYFKKARYVDIVHNISFWKIMKLMINFLISPEYSISEGFRTLRGKGLQFTMNAMYAEIKKVDFTKEIKSIKVPLYFFEGKYDMVTPTIVVEKFFRNLDAEKGKKLVIFEDSAHFLMLEEKQKYINSLLSVLQEVIE